MSSELESIKLRLREFAKERDWDQFHSPKNFSMAMIVECAELVEHFQWLTDEQSKRLPEETLDEVSLEMADIKFEDILKEKTEVKRKNMHLRADTHILPTQATIVCQICKRTFYALSMNIGLISYLRTQKCH